MVKNKFPIILLVIISFFVSGAVIVNPIPNSVNNDGPYHVYLPLVFKPVPPPPPAPPTEYSISRYMEASSFPYSYNYGCEIGFRDNQLPGYQDSVVILAYGQPWFEDNKYGTWAFDGFVDTTEIAESAKQFAKGYWECSGSDTTSQIDIAIGTSNFAKYEYGVCTSGSWFCTTSRAYNHGEEWVKMVEGVYDWVIKQGYASQITISGANDIEPGWNTPEISKAWADGFDDHDKGIYIFYNFGSCDNCPTRLNPNLTPPWTMEEIYYTAWKSAPVWPIPEIYATSGIHARQWAYLSYWAVTHGLSKIEFAGSLTQYGACHQSPSNLLYCNRGTETETDDLDNTPQEGWQQLFDEINYWTQTTQPYLRWMTDIRWP